MEVVFKTFGYVVLTIAALYLLLGMAVVVCAIIAGIND